MLHAQICKASQNRHQSKSAYRFSGCVNILTIWLLIFSKNGFACAISLQIYLFNTRKKKTNTYKKSDLVFFFTNSHWSIIIVTNTPKLFLHFRSREYVFRSAIPNKIHQIFNLIVSCSSIRSNINNFLHENWNRI